MQRYALTLVLCLMTVFTRAQAVPDTGTDRVSDGRDTVLLVHAHGCEWIMDPCDYWPLYYAYGYPGLFDYYCSCYPLIDNRWEYWYVYGNFRARFPWASYSPYHGRRFHRSYRNYVHRQRAAGVRVYRPDPYPVPMRYFPQREIYRGNFRTGRHR